MLACLADNALQDEIIPVCIIDSPWPAMTAADAVSSPQPAMRLSIDWPVHRFIINQVRRYPGVHASRLMDEPPRLYQISYLEYSARLTCENIVLCLSQLTQNYPDVGKINFLLFNQYVIIYTHFCYSSFDKIIDFGFVDLSELIFSVFV